MPSANYPRPWNEMTEFERVSHRIYSKAEVGEEDECWLWTGALVGNGYPHIGQVTLYGEFKKFPYGHRTSWALTNGRWPAAGEVVMHTCDVPRCVNPNHLVVGTAQQNAADRARTGRWFGAGVGKLTPDQVRWARSNGLTQVETAEQLNISQPAVCRLRAGKSYRNVD